MLKITFLLVMAVHLCLGAPVWARVRVTTTTTDLASLVEIIGGDRVDVTSLSRPLQDAHYLDATPGMIMRISRSDMFVENGLELELGWVPEVLRETRNRKVRRGGEGYVDASRGIQAIQIPEVITRDMGDVHPSGNPHYTLEPVRSQQAARNIADGLIRVDGGHRDTYLANLQAYIEQSDALVQEWVDTFEPYHGGGVLVYHKHFDYMLKKLGLNIVYAIEPLPGLAPSAGHVARLISSHSPETVSLVIMEPWHDQRVGQQVADGIGAPLIVAGPAVGSCDEAACILTLFGANASRIYQAISATDGE